MFKTNLLRIINTDIAMDKINCHYIKALPKNNYSSVKSIYNLTVLGSTIHSRVFPLEENQEFQG